MKKILIIILLTIPLHLLAIEQKEIYIQATDAYKAKDFKTSYSLFSKLYITNLSDANLNFMLGVSAYEIGNYNIALAAFERVEMLDPANLRNKLEKARTFYMLKMYENAELSFKEVLSNPLIPQNVRENIEIYLSRMIKEQKKSFTYVTLNINTIYDSNVNNAPIDDTYNIGITRYATAKEKSDGAVETSVGITNIYDIGEANGFALKNKAFVYIKRHFQRDEYDINYFSYMPSLLYKYTKYTFEMAGGVDAMTLGDKSYLQTLSLMPRFEYEHSQTLRSLTHFRYQVKEFKQESQKDLNANHYEISYGLQSILTPRSYIQANITGVQEKKKRGTRVDVDYEEYKFDVAYANQITPTYGAELYSQIRKREYNDYSGLFNSKRDDLAKSVGVGLSVRMFEDLLLRFNARYDRVDSNQDVFSYEKYTLSAGVVKTF
ncbi:MAG: surface lipoprotein assembly modifier [Sulfurimonas sp.]|nr:surface lipoprotein assembly modifier [Sulfurimonas sp.]MDD3834003.1 surface lipoprotein assembly modifier [Sulfurimonas sp.]